MPCIDYCVPGATRYSAFIVFGMYCCFQYSVPVGRACHSCLCMTLYLLMDRYICTYECALAQTRLQPWLVYPVWEDYQISLNGVWFWIVSWLPVAHPVFPPSPWYNCIGWLGVTVIYQVTYPPLFPPPLSGSFSCNHGCRSGLAEDCHWEGWLYRQNPDWHGCGSLWILQGWEVWLGLQKQGFQTRDLGECSWSQLKGCIKWAKSMFKESWCHCVKMS